jgi:hypothetical protein
MADSEKRVPDVFSGYGSKRTIASVLSMLQYLKKKNQPIALGSTSKNIRPILEKTNQTLF